MKRHQGGINPLKGPGLFAGKGSEGSGRRTEVTNEPAIEVGEPNKMLEFLNY